MTNEPKVGESRVFVKRADTSTQMTQRLQGVSVNRFGRCVRFEMPQPCDWIDMPASDAIDIARRMEELVIAIRLSPQPEPDKPYAKVRSFAVDKIGKRVRITFTALTSHFDAPPEGALALARAMKQKAAEVSPHG